MTLLELLELKKKMSKNDAKVFDKCLNFILGSLTAPNMTIYCQMMGMGEKEANRKLDRLILKYKENK